MKRFAATLASQLASAVPTTAPHIEAALKAYPGLLEDRVSLTIQLERLVYEPFQAAMSRRGRGLGRILAKGPFIVVIDGLDECDNKQGVMEFIDQLLEFFREHPTIPLRFFIASRVEEHIRTRLETDAVFLGDLDTHSAHKDIQLFLRASFQDKVVNDRVIQAYIREHGEWPTKSVMRELTSHIGGSFILAATIFNFIFPPAIENDSDPSTPMDRLPLTLRMNGLDDLYTQALTRSQHLPHFRDIISTVALLLRPLPIVEIANLLGVEAFEVVRVLLNLRAIIHVPGRDREGDVTLCHASLRDFLTTDRRSSCFFVPPWFLLRLSYRYFLSDFRKGRGATYYYRHTPLFTHYSNYFAASSSSDLTIEIEWFKDCKSPHLDTPPLHAFLSSALSHSFLINPPPVEFSSTLLLYMLTESTRHLAMAVEHPDARIRFWLNRRLPIVISTVRNQTIEFTKHTYESLQRNLQRASIAIQANFPELLRQPRLVGTDAEYTINGGLWVGPLDTFNALEWIVARAQRKWVELNQSPRPPLELVISQEMVRPGPDDNAESWAVRRRAHAFDVRFSFDG
ncbi:hypothetical protein EST38_g1301 [Candolleomyces aberdarensis]|uniref:Nephrocystin 3-like N-terminal domain-containing protein n=1 Tax=Candolleomyces aberdarensis TaxID=2316362 RepID=A0A4Q2DW69_9AGAR|nr:hypothetical protein EST38_g1301 [Candolleomyces aberdarensis]